MKRLVFLMIVLSIFLVSCSGKAYDEALKKGYDYLENAKYAEASEQFTIALEKKETEEAEKALRVSDAMFAGWDAIRAGTFNSAVEIAHNILIDNKENEATRIVVKDAEDLLEQAEELLNLYNDIKSKIDEADLLYDNHSYEDALVIYKEIAEISHDHFVIDNLIADAKEKISEIMALIDDEDYDVNGESDGESDSPDSGEKDGTENDDDPDNTIDNNGSSGEITKANAEKIIRQGIGVHDEVNVKVDHEDGDFYIIQVFEVVGEGEGSHTATWGWYKVNKKTGAWEEAF